MHDFCASREEEGNERVSLSDYLSEISLLTDLDSEEGEGARITLMTIHSAKGLEFKNVFVVGLEENLFPSPMASGSYRQLEEERRLFYVAITRAEEHCFLSFAKSRFKYGKMEFSNPSRFLRDIDARYLKLAFGREYSCKPEAGHIRCSAFCQARTASHVAQSISLFGFGREAFFSSWNRSGSRADYRARAFRHR